MSSTWPSEPPSVQSVDRPSPSEMDLPPMTTEESTAAFEWSELFDYTIDEQFLVSLDSFNQNQNPPPELSPELPPVAPASRVEASDRVRKRDPRMVCSNFLAGRVPCSCPEIDEKMEEAEGGPGKKKVRTARAGGVARCQVPGCEADISELKGYHRRHRVCLRCANATSVLLDGESKRYCQQCGKFHVLLDFDEGKRSCRRKLERHNHRRRQKTTGSRGACENDTEVDLLCEDVSSDGEAGRGNECSSSQISENERELLQDSKDRNVSKPCLEPDSHNMHSDSIVAFVASGEAQGDRVKDNSRYDLSPSYCNNKGTYLSMCPTGRISFKLYDWNPAEFPRRLRHQIFEWLASMPVELEGYIRPGCTILTAFISMPQFMWMKLLEDPASCLRDFLGPGGMLWGRGTALVYLNDRIFRVLKDGTSVMKVKVAVAAPKLHYVYPCCFEAGKPVEFVACGRNLFQPKFRSLVSFAGKYLAHDYYVVFPQGKAELEVSVSFDHQWCKICVPYMEPECFGPAFIEVENESGLSNFIPILIGDKEVCSEIKSIQERCDALVCKENAQLRGNDLLHDSCEGPCSREMTFSDFVTDVAWLLKRPLLERVQHVMTSLHIQRFNCMLNFLINSESTFILDRILQSLKIVVDEMDSATVTDGIADADRKLFQKYVGRARDLLRQRLKAEEHIVQNSENSFPAVFGNNVLPVAFSDHLAMERKAQWNLKLLDCSEQREETVPLLSGDVAIKVDGTREWPRKSYNLFLLNRITHSRALVYMLVAVALCFGLCAIFLHPYEIHRFVITIRRCLLDDSL